MPNIRLGLVVFIAFKKGNCCRVVHTRLNKEQVLLPQEMACLPCGLKFPPFFFCTFSLPHRYQENFYKECCSKIIFCPATKNKTIHLQRKKKITNTKKIHASFSKFLKCFYSNLITILSIKTFCSFVRVTSPRGKEKKEVDKRGGEGQASFKEAWKQEENKNMITRSISTGCERCSKMICLVTKWNLFEIH